MIDPKDPFGRPLDTEGPEIVPSEELAGRVAERDAEEESDEEEDLEDISDLDDEPETE